MPTDDSIKRRCWRSWPRRPAIRRTCWIWISISKPTSALTPSSRRRCSPPFARRTTFRATRISSCATSPPWPTYRFAQTGGRRLRRQPRQPGQRRSPPRQLRPVVAVRRHGSVCQLRCRQQHSTPRAGAHPAPAAQLCKPTGVTLARQRVVLMPDRGGVADALRNGCRALGVEVLRIEDAPDADALTNRLNNWLAAGPVQGVYWLPALDRRGQPSATWTWPAGTKPCGCASSLCTPPCALCTSRSRRRAHSWCRQHGWAASTATTRPERSLPWAAPWWLHQGLQARADGSPGQGR